jgi:competence protein ComEA
MKRSFAVLALAASLLAGPALAQTAQTPQTGAAPGTRPAAPAASTTPSAAPTAPAASTAAPAKVQLIDINTASKEELDKLPGVGPARAEAIIKNRPYNGKDELRRKKVLPESLYQGIRERIIARQS